MKFGIYLSEHLYLPWKQEYLDYNSLKAVLKGTPIWTFEDEINFTRYNIDAEYERISRFIQLKMKQYDKAELLLNFIRLNTIAFKKILKKHDKWTEFTLQHRFKGWDKYIMEINQTLGLMYHEMTYWIHHDQLKELEAILLFNLPKRQERTIQSVYYDYKDNFKLYSNVLKKKKDADLIRTTTWQETGNSITLFERKIFHDLQTTLETSYLQPRLADKYLQGELTPASLQEDLEMYLDPKITNLTLFETIQSTQPILQCRYQSTLYSADASCLMTLKTHISFHNDTNLKRHFPYVVLTLQTIEGIPEWLAGLTESNRLVLKIPYFEEYLHGMILLFQHELPLLPWWHGTKLTEERFDSKDPIHKRLINSSLMMMIKHPFGETDQLPVYSKSNDDMNLLKWLAAKIKQDKAILLTKHISKKSERLEPKLFLGNERTLMSWLTFCALLLTLSLSLLNFGDQISRESGALFILIAIGLAGYALLRFQYRAWQIQFRGENRFDDIYGPMGLCFVFVLALTVNFGLRVNHPAEGTAHPLNKTD